MVRQYVGARYVPKFADPVAWTRGTSYEAMTIVTYNNSSYTSKIPVPATVGDPADNPDYWALTGNYNAQVEQYRQETETVSNNLTTEITNLKNADTTLQGQITTEITNRETADDTLQGQINTEITNRKNADTTLQDQITTASNNLTTEITNRKNADTTLQGNINSEAATRASADSNLQSQINQIVSPSGEAPSAAEVQNARIGADGVTYDTLGTAIRTQVNNINNDLSSLKNELIDTGFQYLMEKNRTNGYYYYLSNNAVVKGGGGTANTHIYAPIVLKAGTTYYYKNLYGYFTLLDDGTTVTRLSDSQNLTSGSITPTVDTKIYISVNDVVTANRIFVDNAINPVKGTEGFYATKINPDNYVHITVKQDGTGNYVEPISAVRSITDSSESKQYIIEIYEGTYELSSQITDSEKQGNRWGLKLPNYVHLRGIGNVDNIILTCNLANNPSTEMVEYTSCLNLEQNNNIENITFSGHNIRYVVHDESSNQYKNWKRIVKNCKFIHTGNEDGYWQYSSAWGEGCSSGSVSEFYNCYFSNNSYVCPVGFHTNKNFERPCYHKYVNCTFDSKYVDIATRGTTGVFGINDMQSGKSVYVDFIDCTFNGFVFIQNNNSTEDWHDIHIGGHGNTPIMFNIYRPNVTSPKNFMYYFSDITRSVINGTNTTISKGKPLFYTNPSENVVGIAENNGIMCCGIALEDIPAKSIGRMQYAGYLQFSLIGLDTSDFAPGAKLGVRNWSIAEDSENYFAYVPSRGVIKFI